MCNIAQNRLQLKINMLAERAWIELGSQDNEPHQCAFDRCPNATNDASRAHASSPTRHNSSLKDSLQGRRLLKRGILPRNGLELSLISINIHHKTTYRYHQPVTLGPHRLMLRPRESRDLRLISSHITVTPKSVLTWAQDVHGNAVAMATFQTMTGNLVIDSVAELQLDAAEWPVLISPPLPSSVRSDIPTMNGPISEL